MKSFSKLTEDIEEKERCKTTAKDQESTLKMKGAAVNRAADKGDTQE